MSEFEYKYALVGCWPDPAPGSSYNQIEHDAMGKARNSHMRYVDSIGWWLHNGKTAAPLRGPTQRECRPRKSDGAKYANERPTLTCADFDHMAAPLGCGARFRLATSNEGISATNTVNILRDGILLCGDCWEQYQHDLPGNTHVGIAELLSNVSTAEPSLVCGSTAKLHWVKDPSKPRQFHTERLSERPRGHWASDEWISDAA